MGYMTSTRVHACTTTRTADAVKVGQTVRICSGPKSGLQGEVANVTRTVQMGTNFAMVIIDFVDGARSARPVGEPVEVLS